jgi:hypothetical protein
MARNDFSTLDRIAVIRKPTQQKAKNCVTEKLKEEVDSNG